MMIFWFFKTAAAAILDFQNVGILDFGKVKRVKMRYGAKFRSDRSNSCGDMAIFRFLKMAAVHHLGFSKSGNFRGRWCQEGENASPCCAKFRNDRSNRCWDMVIFQFFQDDGRPSSWIYVERVWTTHERHLVVFITVQNLVGMDRVVLIICILCNFTSLAGKRLFTAQN